MAPVVGGHGVLEDQNNHSTVYGNANGLEKKEDRRSENFIVIGTGIPISELQGPTP